MAPPSAGTGILTNVLSFVSRELESFVTTAIGGSDPNAYPSAEASTSRVKLDDKARKRETRRRVKEAKDRQTRQEEQAREEIGVRRRRRMGSDGEPELSERPRRRTARKSRSVMRKSSSPTPTPIPKAVPAVDNTGPLDEESRSHSLDPKPIPALNVRSPLVTMPGSLFPRSASLQPDATPSPAEVTRRVHFISRTPTPSCVSPGLSHHENTNYAADDEDDSDESSRNDGSRGSNRRRSDRRKSQRTLLDELSTAADPTPIVDSLGETDDLHPDPTSDTAWEEMRDEHMSQAHENSIRAKGKERACDTSGEIRVRGKEQELRAAREAHLRDEPRRDDDERERDKRRIRQLEEEIARLKAELATRDYSIPAPPPPPTRIPTLSDMSAGPNPVRVPGRADSFLASARAKLKPTAPPAEAPINSAISRTKRTGQPTVNVPSDKMAAFLKEMKTVRLRRVSGSASSLMPPPPSVSREYAFGERSFSTVESRIGDKRKRNELAAMEGPSSVPAKRRLTTFVLPRDNTGTSSASGSGSNSANTSQTSIDFHASGPSSSSLSFPPPAHLPPRTWPSVSTTETDLTTPSLCSDNDNEHDQDVEDRILHTPPHPSRIRHVVTEEYTSVKGKGKARELVPEVVVREPPVVVQPERLTVTEKTPPFIDFLAQRQPKSPLPTTTPKRARPPARNRTKQQTTPYPRTPETDGMDSDDSLSYAPDISIHVSRYGSLPGFDPEEYAPSKIPVKVGTQNHPRSRTVSNASREREPNAGANTPATTGSQANSAVASRAQRRRTLDRELQRAGDSLWDDDDLPDAGDAGELVGVGTMSKTMGFLKGGGAGGIPVYADVGHVQGAEKGDDWGKPPPKPTVKRRMSVNIRD